MSMYCYKTMTSSLWGVYTEHCTADGGDRTSLSHRSAACHLKTRGDHHSVDSVGMDECLNVWRKRLLWEAVFFCFCVYIHLYFIVLFSCCKTPMGKLQYKASYLLLYYMCYMKHAGLIEHEHSMSSSSHTLPQPGPAPHVFSRTVALEPWRVIDIEEGNCPWALIS